MAYADTICLFVCFIGFSAHQHSICHPRRKYIGKSKFDTKHVKGVPRRTHVHTLNHGNDNYEKPKIQ